FRFLPQAPGFLDLSHPIPIYLAANGPLALRAVAEFGDGLVSVGNEIPQVLAAHLAGFNEGAKRVGRALPKDFHTTTLTSAVVLRPGEKVDSDRVVEQCGSQVAALLHFAYHIFNLPHNPPPIPPPLQA